MLGRENFGKWAKCAIKEKGCKVADWPAVGESVENDVTCMGSVIDPNLLRPQAGKMPGKIANAIG